MFIIGDKIEVTEHPEPKYVSKTGVVTHVGSANQTGTPPAEGNLPKPGAAYRYSVKLDIGQELHYLRESQLRRL